MQHDSIRAISWQKDSLVLLDQRYLPGSEQYITCTEIDCVIDAIRNMVVRGAPAIGITAAYGIVLMVKSLIQTHAGKWRQFVDAALDDLSRARPTAINLNWAIAQMRPLIDEPGESDILSRLAARARAIHEQDIQANMRMGEFGASLITSGVRVLTHCNAGALATGGYGTALGVIRSLHSNGMLQQVYADETRPWLQGARLTAWELLRDDIPVSLIADSAAAYLMKQGRIDWVIVGSDRIAANGDVANKIGTYSAAVNARYHGVKFMVVAPTTTIDMDTACGDDIPIEFRDSTELVKVAGQQVAATGSDAWNPVFDVTPADLVDAIVTERGVILQPDREKMLEHMSV